MTKCDGIKLGQLLDCVGQGTVLHIAAEDGNGWYFTGTAAEATTKLSTWSEREITCMYTHEGREASRYCCKLEPGIAVLVEGHENGQY